MNNCVDFLGVRGKNQRFCVVVDAIQIAWNRVQYRAYFCVAEIAILCSLCVVITEFWVVYLGCSKLTTRN